MIKHRALITAGLGAYGSFRARPSMNTEVKIKYIRIAYTHCNITNSNYDKEALLPRRGGIGIYYGQLSGLLKVTAFADTLQKTLVKKA